MPTNYLRRNMDLACSFSDNIFTLTIDSSYPVRIGGQVIKTFIASDPYTIYASFNVLNAAGESIVSISNSNVYDISGNSISSTTYNNKQFPFYKSYNDINTNTGKIEENTGTGIYSIDSGSSETVSSIFKTGDEVTCIIDIDNAKIYICSETMLKHLMESCADIDNFLTNTFPNYYDYVMRQIASLRMFDDLDHSDNANISERIEETLADAIAYQDSSLERYAYMRITQADNYILDSGNIIYGNYSVNELYRNADNILVAPISYVKCESDSTMHIVNTPYCWFSVYNATGNDTNYEFSRNIAIGSTITSGSDQKVLLYSTYSNSNTSNQYDFEYAIAYFKLLYPNFVDGTTTLDELTNIDNNAVYYSNSENIIYISLEFVQTPVNISKEIKTSANKNVNDIYAVYDLSDIEMLYGHTNIYGYVSDDFINRFCTEYNSTMYSFLNNNSSTTSGDKTFSESLFSTKNSSTNRENYYWGAASTSSVNCSYSASTNSITCSRGSSYCGFYPIPKSTKFFNAVFKTDLRLSIKISNTVIDIPVNLTCRSRRSSNTKIDLYNNMSDLVGSWWNGTFMSKSLELDNGFYLDSSDSIKYVDMLFDTIDSDSVNLLCLTMPSYLVYSDTGEARYIWQIYNSSTSQNSMSVNFYIESADIKKSTKNVTNLKYLTMPIAEFSLNYTKFLNSYGNFVLNSNDVSNKYTGALGSSYNNDDNGLYNMSYSSNYLRYALVSRDDRNNTTDNDGTHYALTTDNSILGTADGINSIVLKIGFEYPIITDTIDNINTNECQILVTHYLYGLGSIASILSGTSTSINDNTNAWLTIKNGNQSCSYNIMNPYNDSKEITLYDFLRYMVNTDTGVLYSRRNNYDFIRHSQHAITPLTVKLSRNDAYVTGATNRTGELTNPLNNGLAVLYCSPSEILYNEKSSDSDKRIYRVNNDTNEEDSSISDIIQLGIGTGQYIAVWFDETGTMCYKSDGSMPTTEETGGIIVSNVVKADDPNDIKIVYDLVMDYTSSDGYVYKSATTYDANGDESTNGTYYKIYNGILKINLDYLQHTPVAIGVLDDDNSFISVTKNSIVARRDSHIDSLSDLSKFSDSIIETINSMGPAYDNSTYSDYVDELYKNIPCYNLYLNTYTHGIASYNDAYELCVQYITTSNSNSDYLIHPSYILNSNGLKKIDLSKTGYPIISDNTLTKNDFLNLYEFFNLGINHYLNINPELESSYKSGDIPWYILDMQNLQNCIDSNTDDDQLYFYTYYLNYGDNYNAFYNKAILPTDSDNNTYESDQNLVRYNMAISGKNKTKSISLTDEYFDDLPLDGTSGIITASEITWSNLLDALNNNKSITVGGNLASTTLEIIEANNATNIDLKVINSSWGDGKTFGTD